MNTNPKQHVNKLYGDLHSKNYKSTLDNKAVGYDQMKGLLKDKIKRNKYERLAHHEHQREIASMNARVQNCKNLQQRKKDNTDPVVNPTYFIKHGTDLPQVTIDSYCQKILASNRPQSAFTQSTRKQGVSQQQWKALSGQEGGSS